MKRKDLFEGACELQFTCFKHLVNICNTAILEMFHDCLLERHNTCSLISKIGLAKH